MQKRRASGCPILIATRWYILKASSSDRQVPKCLCATLTAFWRHTQLTLQLQSAMSCITCIWYGSVSRNFAKLCWQTSELAMWGEKASAWHTETVCKRSSEVKLRQGASSALRHHSAQCTLSTVHTARRRLAMDESVKSLHSTHQSRWTSALRHMHDM